jgi:hypothetical protein
VDLFISYLTDISGALGAILVICAFLLKNPRHIMAVSFISSVLWVVHFGLIGAWAGVIVSVSSALRNAAAFVVFFGLWIDSAGAVVLFAAPIRAVANHLRDREIPFRIVCSLSAICYVIYGLMIGSPLWISSLVAFSVVVGTPLVRLSVSRWKLRYQ